MRRQRVFISSVMRAYEDRRKAAEGVIQALGMEQVLAETLNASCEAPRDIILNDTIRAARP
ncbi:MAG: DUF4062 domain-containing protein [Proteobacteria bacterium]|nr:DUF4062 domain-containing protein [Pseudomonadota bacterium]MBU1233883.1 DUF4062 domain-containing protein [Pseudomonadota bacterium]MBU1417539.1 DUF4062 domain-containing protein [Pseudomonadota bacterium]MBU1453114.1 DUF4062 domain-containing protein [Pseudomonadota bacterium]